MIDELDPERWQRMWSIFGQALDLPRGTERQAFIAASVDDPLILHTLEQLLRAEAGAEGFLEQPVVDLAGDADHQEAARLPQGTEVIGPYRLLHQIGEGGMGTVFLAVRDDDSFQRRVVIKVVRRGAETADTLRRLRTERQILASLDHPHIARLFDGGTTAGQLPYFVMEYVDGVPIDAHCDQHRLSIDQRLTLFRDVCKAVQYAHQNLVVHRDLKPSNILVTAEGVPKLLDFGIAKLLNPELAAPEVEPTAIWQRRLTPHYASPEQLRGQFVTTTSDVYSLGVLLYKILCGSFPYDFMGRSPEEIVQVLTGSEPVAPSRLFAPASRAKTGDEAGSLPPIDELARKRDSKPVALRRQLAGDLDSIVLKALRSAPKQRYPSVEQFSDDIERHQVGLAVRARRGTWRYRAAKSIRRNRGEVTLLAAVSLLLLGFSIAMALQSSRVARERDQKQAVKELLLDLISVTDPAISLEQKKNMTVREALDRSGEVLEVQYQDDLDLRSEILQTIGAAYRSLGVANLASDNLEEALEIRRDRFGSESREFAETLSTLAVVRKDQGRWEEAEQRAAEAVEILRLPGVASDRERLPALNSLIAIYCEKAAYTEAEPLAQEALAIARKVSIRDEGFSFALNSLAVIHSAQGKHEEAAKFYEESILSLRSIFGDHHQRQLIPLNNLALELRQLGRFAEAEATYRRTIELEELALGVGHPETARTLNNLAGVLVAQERFKEAEVAYRKALQMIQETFGPDHRRAFFVGLRLEDTRTRQGVAQDAEKQLRQMLIRAREILPEGDGMLTFGAGIHGTALVALERFEEAEPLLVDSYLAALAQGKQRRRDEALGRLEELYKAWGQEENIQKYLAMSDGTSK